MKPSKCQDSNRTNRVHDSFPRHSTYSTRSQANEVSLYDQPVIVSCAPAVCSQNRPDITTKRREESSMRPGRSAPSLPMRHRSTLLIKLLSVMVRAGAAAWSHTPRGGCKNPAVIRTAVGSGKNSEHASKVYDSNLKSKWIAWGEGESIRLELATPTVIGSVAIAFRKVRHDKFPWPVLSLSEPGTLEVLHDVSLYFR